MQPDIDLRLLSPEIALSVTILVVLVADTFLSKQRKRYSMFIALAGVMASFGCVLALAGDSGSTLGGAFEVGGFVLPMKGFFLLVGVATLVMSLRYVDDEIGYQGEFYFLLLCSLLGCLVMPSARDLITLFIAIELVSAPVFLLATFRKKDLESNEAGLKFFIFGVLSSTVMLYGMSLIYGLTGTTTSSGIVAELGAAEVTPVLLAAVLMVMVGFGFKVSAVPFHFWAPDTYEGAPLPVVAFLSVASKAAGFVGLVIVLAMFAPLAEFWAPVVAVLSVLTMTLGNLVALQQKQMVRLMAYSSIAQAGYILLPLALVQWTDTELNEQILASVFLYIFIYAVMNLGLFAAIIGMNPQAPAQNISDYSGLMKRAPAFAIAMVMFLVSLGGIPPLAGFWAKFFIFKVAIEAGGPGPALAAAMVVNSVIGLYYYLGVAKTVTLREGIEEPIRFPPSIVAVVGAAAVLILAVGVYPDLFAKFLN